jgi:hypothetical protein
MATKKKQAPAGDETLDKGGYQRGDKMKPIFAGKGAQKAFPNGQEGGGQDDDDDEEEDDEAMKAKKSMDLSEDDLQKSLDKLSAIVEDGEPVTRKESLLKKSLGGEDLSKAETAELFKLMGGEEEPKEPELSKAVEQIYTDNETLQKATDVSDYLDESQKALIKSLTVLSDRIESGDTRQHEFNLVLAKAVSGVGKLVKGMSERLGVIEGQPARAPKSRGVQPGQVLHKAFGGEASPGDQLNQTQVLDGLETLMQKSMGEGRGGFTESGENIMLATAKFEQTRQITPTLLSEIRRLPGSGAQH